jgi:hypothetical protein
MLILANFHETLFSWKWPFLRIIQILTKTAQKCSLCFTGWWPVLHFCNKFSKSEHFLIFAIFFIIFVFWQGNFAKIQKNYFHENAKTKIFVAALITTLWETEPPNVAIKIDLSYYCILWSVPRRKKIFTKLGSGSGGDQDGLPALSFTYSTKQN